MSRNRRVLGLLLAIAVLGTGAWAQSLGDAAKKEKERRAKIPGKPTRVIRDHELGTGSVPVPTEEESAGTTGAASGQTAGAAAGQPAAPAADEAKTREHWQKRIQQKQEEISKLEQQLAGPDANWGGGVRTDVNPLGQRNLENRAQLEKQLSQKRAELEAIREEGRRAGVPAGWLR